MKRIYVAVWIKSENKAHRSLSRESLIWRIITMTVIVKCEETVWPLKAGVGTRGRTDRRASVLFGAGVFQPPARSDRSLAPQGLSSSGDAQQAVGWAGCSGAEANSNCWPGVCSGRGHQGWRGLQSVCGPRDMQGRERQSSAGRKHTSFTACEWSGGGCKVAEGPRLGEATPEVLRPGCLPWNLHDKLCLLPCPSWPLLNNTVLTLKVCYSKEFHYWRADIEGCIQSWGNKWITSMIYRFKGENDVKFPNDQDLIAFLKDEW